VVVNSRIVHVPHMLLTKSFSFFDFISSPPFFLPPFPFSFCFFFSSIFLSPTCDFVDPPPPPPLCSFIGLSCLVPPLPLPPPVPPGPRRFFPLPFVARLLLPPALAPHSVYFWFARKLTSSIVVPPLFAYFLIFSQRTFCFPVSVACLTHFRFES